jgi:hypothetical protein
LIDGLMAELGMAGGSLNGMLSGSSADGRHVTPTQHAAGTNGAAAPKSDAAR